MLFLEKDLERIIKETPNHLISIYTYDYKFDGIRFKKHNSYSLIDRGF